MANSIGGHSLTQHSGSTNEVDIAEREKFYEIQRKVSSNLKSLTKTDECILFSLFMEEFHSRLSTDPEIKFQLSAFDCDLATVEGCAEFNRVLEHMTDSNPFAMSFDKFIRLYRKALAELVPYPFHHDSRN